MSVTLTEKAASHVEEFLRKRGKGVGLRVGVKTSGCSGMAYALEFADKIERERKLRLRQVFPCLTETEALWRR